MKQNEIRRIMNHVFCTVNCPHCGTSDIYKGETKIDLNTDMGLIFHIKCHKCHNLMKINGLLPEKISAKTKRKSEINQQALDKEVQKIKGFRGNLSNLFN